MEKPEEQQILQLSQQSFASVPVSNEKMHSEIEREIQEKKTNLFESIPAYKQQELYKESLETCQQVPNEESRNDWKTVTTKKVNKKEEVKPAAPEPANIGTKKPKKFITKPKDLKAKSIMLEQEFDDWIQHVLEKVTTNIDGEL